MSTLCINQTEQVPIAKALISYCKVPSGIESDGFFKSPEREAPMVESVRFLIKV